MVKLEATRSAASAPWGSALSAACLVVAIVSGAWAQAPARPAAAATAKLSAADEAAGWAAGTAWNWATWPVLGGWYGWGAGDPIYYDYGTNITYQGDQVYYGDAPVATADQYYQQADAIAQSNPPSKGADDDWTPLGVFGLVQGDQTSASAVFQLATNKSGAIQGNFSDMLTGATMKVNGAVEKKTQRAAWTVGDNKDIVYDTGIYNLTKDEAPILVHFGKDRTQQWMLVRLKQPDDQKGGGTQDAQ